MSILVFINNASRSIRYKRTDELAVRFIVELPCYQKLWVLIIFVYIYDLILFLMLFSTGEKDRKSRSLQVQHVFNCALTLLY